MHDNSNESAKPEILDDRIARSDLWFYPGEKVGADEIRVTLMGTGWGNIIRPNQKGASIYIEVGNGDAFVFDAGPGCGINYNVMQVPFSKMDKVFLTHLHTDHCSDLPWIYTFGPATDRFTPLHLFGPHNFQARDSAGRVIPGDIPNLHRFVQGLKYFTEWHTVSFETTLQVGHGYEIEVHPLNYLQTPPVVFEPNAGASSDPPGPGIAYQENGVTIRHWPALHIIDGAISYRLDWNGMSVVWSGDTQPNHYTVDHARGVDLLIHETAPDLSRFVQAQQISPQQGQTIIDYSHTPAKALGKILKYTNPKLGVTCHCPVDPQEWARLIGAVRVSWDGEYQIGEDLMVFTLSKSAPRPTIRKCGIHERPWGVTLEQRDAASPKFRDQPLNVREYRTPEVFAQKLKDEQSGGES
jgi:ribonuclease Z